MNSQLSAIVAQSRQQDLHRAAAQARQAADIKRTSRPRRLRSLMGMLKPAPAQPVQSSSAHIRTA
jgi:hypothetical protein